MHLCHDFAVAANLSWDLWLVLHLCGDSHTGIVHMLNQPVEKWVFLKKAITPLGVVLIILLKGDF